MMRSYNKVSTIENLKDAEFKLVIYDGPKWEPQYTGVVVYYTGIVSWDIIEGGSEAEEIESMTDSNSQDEKHEYLVLHYENGETATFRNSHVDMFIR